jgi:hypothetical protein
MYIFIFRFISVDVNLDIPTKGCTGVCWMSTAIATRALLCRRIAQARHCRQTYMRAIMFYVFA